MRAPSFSFVASKDNKSPTRTEFPKKKKITAKEICNTFTKISLYVLRQGHLKTKDTHGFNQKLHLEEIVLSNRTVKPQLVF